MVKSETANNNLRIDRGLFDKEESDKICDKEFDIQLVQTEEKTSMSNPNGLKNTLRISSLNIRRGLNSKEEELILTIQDQNCDVCSLSEVDIEDFDEKKPFSIEGYKTFFPLKRTGTNTKRLICFVKVCIEAKQRDDLMSESLSNVWLEIKGINQKVLICAIYREFNDLTGKGPMNIEQQLERLEILHTQIEKASKEGLILIIGDMNIDLKKWEDGPKYYQKKQAEKYQSLIGECGLEVIDFGITFNSNKNGEVISSALDHAITNKPIAINNYHKTFIDSDISDHYMISVDLNIKTPKLQEKVITSRDFRKLRRNPGYFLDELRKVKWEIYRDMEDVDPMEEFWTKEINKCMDIVAPWKSRKVRQKRFDLPKEVRSVIKVRNDLKKKVQVNAKNGIEDLKLEEQFKKHRNYCNKMIKNAVRENAGKNITSASNVKDIWNSIGDILKPERLAKPSIKIQSGDKLIEDPLQLAETFNVFFKEKVEKLAASIKKQPINGRNPDYLDPDYDPFIRLREKLRDSKLIFNLKTVSEKVVLGIFKALKPKKSCGIDGITSEILKIGSEVLVVPLTYIVNCSITTGKYPSIWKIAKVIALHKKGDKKTLKNYRPVSLLAVAGMILERVVALQIEQFFERNGLLGKFQFGFRRNKSTISELLTLFDTLLEAKEMKREILIILYDLSAAFDTVPHQILIEKLRLYGFCQLAIKWIVSYLSNRKQFVEISGKRSGEEVINIGTPQGSRLSPLLFIILMADLDLWTENSTLSNFADDTQSIIVSDNRKNLLETASIEANNVINFFRSNGLVNNADKAAVLYNGKGKCEVITVENVGGEDLLSTYSEKLLGLHINADFVWSTHIDKLSIELKKRTGLLRRIQKRVPKEKIVIIAEAIFNSLLRYGVAVFLKPVYDKEDLKMKKLPKDTTTLQTLQNSMLRVIFGLKLKNHINMKNVREEIKMMSVNQISVYHTLLEAYNVMRHLSSDQIHMKWTIIERKYALRSITKGDLKVPDKPKLKCLGFTYNGAKLFNMLPVQMRKLEEPNTFKTMTKDWIWENIPSH